MDHTDINRPDRVPALLPPKDLSHHLSWVTRNRQASSVKQFYKYFLIPGIGQLAGGLPSSHYFPYDDLEAKVAMPDRWTPTPNKPVDPPSTRPKASDGASAARVIVPTASSEPDPQRKIDVASALQYGTAQGYPALFNFVRQFTREHLHPNVPYEGGPEIILTVGSTDGFQKTLQCLNNEWVPGRDPIERKEGLLCEQYAYMNAVQAARPRGMNIVPVVVDDQGMCAAGKGGLQDVLENWDYNRGRRPHLMYTVTIGQNPTSGTLSVTRRKEIYAVCEKYDVIIVEDDPYWYLQYPSARNASEHSDPDESETGTKKSSGYDYLDSLVPSYLSVDKSGRVVRLDTFSKTVAPGCRLGWITAQPALVERILRITETSTQQPSGFVQAMMAELLVGPAKSDSDGRGGSKNGEGWKMDGWVRWLEGLRGQYERRMTKMCDILDEGKEIVKQGRRNSLTKLTAELSVQEFSSTTAEDESWAVVEKTRMYDFVRPLGGMFIWVKFDFSTHPLASKVALPRLARALWVYWTTKPWLLIVSPGALFAPTPEILAESAWQYFRLCFAAVEPDILEDVSRRFARGSKSFWRIRDVSKIDDLLEEDSLNVDPDMNKASLMGFC